MLVFQVSSRSVQAAARLSKRRPWLHRRWYPYLRFFWILPIISIFIGQASRSGLIFLFVLLPVTLSVLTTRSQFSRLNVFLNGTLLSSLLTVCLALIYYSTIVTFELLTHPTSLDRLILVSTTLAWAVLFEPARRYAQAWIEQRFNLRNRAAAKALTAFASTLRETIDLDKVRDATIDVIQQTMQPQYLTLWTRQSAQNQLAPTSSDTVEIALAEDDPFALYLTTHPGTIKMANLHLASPTFVDLQAHEVELLFPLTSQGQLIGLLALGLHQGGEDYTPEDHALLSSLAAQVAPALRVAQIVQEQQEQVRQHERIEQELRTAHDIQQTFLPKNVPDLPGWQLTPYYQPARELGGDFYDFLSLSDGRLGIVIGDVTGKGIPAALVMTATRTMLRTAALQQSSPGAVLERVNNLLASEIPPGMFVTCFYAILDPISGQLDYSNAGQDWPYLKHNTSVTTIEANGMPLGMLPGSLYDEHTTTLSPSSSLLLYSDGLVEAHSPTGEMFGLPRLNTLLQQQPESAPLINTLLTELHHFTGPTWEQEDDVTLVTIQRSQIPTSLDQTHETAVRPIKQQQ